MFLYAIIITSWHPEILSGLVFTIPSSPIYRSSCKLIPATPRKNEDDLPAMLWNVPGSRPHMVREVAWESRTLAVYATFKRPERKKAEKKNVFLISWNFLSTWELLIWSTVYRFKLILLIQVCLTKSLHHFHQAVLGPQNQFLFQIHLLLLYRGPWWDCLKQRRNNGQTWTFNGSQPFNLPLPEIRPYSGLINKWSPLIMPCQTLVSEGGTLGGVGWPVMNFASNLVWWF